MQDYPNLSMWMEWWVIQDDRVALYIWNNLPDPKGLGKRYGFPNSTILKYAGDGKWSYEEDFYNPVDAERVWSEWFQDGGRPEVSIDRNLKGTFLENTVVFRSCAPPFFLSVRSFHFVLSNSQINILGWEVRVL